MLRKLERSLRPIDLNPPWPTAHHAADEAVVASIPIRISKEMILAIGGRLLRVPSPWLTLVEIRATLGKGQCVVIGNTILKTYDPTPVTQIVTPLPYLCIVNL